jgi:Glycosyl hydrolases family 2, TIM barrel domain/Glycosyl hydrolases family 2, sugar binding domain/Glycosyl hydrolases family 2/Domain of unknown function (DUF4982)/F5/8 type C domain
MALLTIAVALTACSNEQPESAYQEGQRIIQPLNEGWRFALPRPDTEQALANAKWHDVTLPHSWNTKDGQDGGDDYYRGRGIYQRDFTLDEQFDGRRLFLHFDGAATVTTVHVNGEFAGEHRGNYGAFRFDISPLVRQGKNTLEVQVSNAPNEGIAPLSADFTFFGGLYRQVRLIATDSVHIDAGNYASSGVFWSQRKVTRQHADLGLNTELVNESNKARQLKVVASLEDASGTVVATADRELSLEAGERSSIEMALQLEQPHLWHGRRDPYLYTARVSVQAEGHEVDSISEPLGLRFFHVDTDKGFFLNGEAYPLRGINRMPDMLNKGTAISREDHERDLQLMLEIGATSVRLGHQQRDPWVYRRADELGFVVWAEIPLINRINDTDEFADNLQQQALELIRQNYNRTSIVVWGLYNEVTLKPGPDPRPLVKRLNELVKAEDPFRLTSAAVAAEGGLEDPLVTIPDLISFNRYDGWYYGNFDSFPEFLDEMRHEAPALRVGIGEYGAGASIEFQTDKPVIQDHSEPYQALYHEAYWEALRERPWLWGHYIWVLADFAVDNRNEGDTPGRNDKGLVTFDRKVKKDAFYWYKAAWSDEPVLHITGRRHTQRIHNKVDIKVYANAESVELKVNGKSLGSQRLEDLPRLVWRDVPLALGDNRIEAIATVDGRSISDEIQLTRINSNDTAINSQLLGTDSSSGKIYNTPFGARLDELTALLELPEESTISIVGGTSDTVLAPGMKVRITAQDRTTTGDYTLQQAPLSVGKPVWASSEISGEMSIGPFDMPEMSAARANDGVVNSDPDQGMLDANIWMTMGGKNHWWKVDLGTEYYLDSIEITWPQHASLLEQGAMTYSVDIAADFQQTFDVFSESYQEVVDQRGNQRPNTTQDPLGVTGRFVQVRLHKSGIHSDTPLVGKYPVYGAEEITVLGGLLYSETLEVDYRERSIVLPQSANAEETLKLLQTVKGGSVQLIDSEGKALHGEAQIPAGASAIARNASGSLAELYSLVVDK